MEAFRVSSTGRDQSAYPNLRRASLTEAHGHLLSMKSMRLHVQTMLLLSTGRDDLFVRSVASTTFSVG